MMRSTGPRDFAVVAYDGGWPPRPNVPVVRWIGDFSLPAQAGLLDQTPDFAPLPPPVVPGDIPNLGEHLIADTATDGGADTAMLTWPSELTGAATVSNAPTMRHAVLNGHKVADFNGSSNFCLTRSWQSGALSQITVLVIAQFDSTANSNVLSNDLGGLQGDFLFGVNANNDIGGLSWPGELSQVIHAAGRAGGMGSGEPIDTLGFHAFIARFLNTGDADLWIDGTKKATDPYPVNGDTITVRAWNIGRNPITPDRYFNGKIAELCWWERFIDDGEVADMTTYSQTRYGTP